LLGFDRGHAAGAGRGDRLPITRVHDVAAGEDAGDVRARAAVGQDIAVRVELDLAFKNFGVGLVADGHEKSAAGNRLHRVRVDVFDFYAFHRFSAQNFLGHGIPNKMNFAIFERALLHDFGGSQFMPAVNEGDFRGELG